MCCCPINYKIVFTHKMCALTIKKKLNMIFICMNSIMCWIYAEEIKLVFNTTEFLIMMAFDFYACSIFAHFRFRFTFILFLLNLTLFSSLLCCAVYVYSATLSLVERRALFACDTISKYWNVWCALVRLCLSFSLSICYTHFHTKLLRSITDRMNMRKRRQLTN